ncbi:fatty acyl-CoA reductase wat-like isoform X2 [Zootermopsis nevadensis]|uniref:fatty acyl-CoA reductase wat-like isoform X2 n=1 Tax=Zootermopsis nevadensis TaxID=136037 RepID=UPI000B8EE4E7|nr:fatty acyl-CoA reductase wat-like isoform X2 [Zootermopsis nevadensis]
MDKKSKAPCKSNILETFRGARVLVTGGTGFVGQVLIEKLLRTCEIDKLYIIARPKNGMTEKERLEKIFDDHLYRRVKHEQPNCMSKVVLVKGDCEQRELGLSRDDHAVLVEEVNIIFHSAATVRFDAKLSTAFAINVLGTKYLLDMAREMPHLKAFVHISTAYSNCVIKEIHEQFYLPALRWTEVAQLIESLDQETIETITPIVLGDYPNTYSFTKSVTEDLIREESRGLPVGILRPSIVVSTASEPVVSWINNLYGAVGVVTGAALGLLKTMYCDSDMPADIVPVDMVINNAIAIAWDLAEHTSENKLPNTDIKTSKNEDKIPIFNYVSSIQNSITWGEFMRLNEVAIIYPSFKCIWYYCFQLNKHRFIHNIYIIFLHLLPAIFIDTGAKIIGKQPIMWKAYQKIHRFTDVIAYYSTQRWIFHNDNVQNLWRKMSPQDKTEISALHNSIFI